MEKKTLHPCVDLERGKCVCECVCSRLGEGKRSLADSSTAGPYGVSPLQLFGFFFYLLSFFFFAQRAFAACLESVFALAAQNGKHGPPQFVPLCTSNGILFHYNRQ